MFFVVLHDFTLHNAILMWYETIGGQIGVVRVVFGHIITARGLHYVAGHQRGSVIVALQRTIGQVTFDLQAK